ncbi:MAG: DUF6351 family protein [Actinomycetota bacterium]
MSSIHKANRHVRAQVRGRPARLLLAVVAVVAAFAPIISRAQDTDLTIEVISNRADLISAGDALVAIALPEGVESTNVRVDLNGADVTNDFAVRANGRFAARLSDLAIGDNEVTATLPDGSGARLVITNHPNGGPIFSGPQVMPWVCQAGAVDVQCNAPETYEFFYMPSGVGGVSGGTAGYSAGGFQSYDKDNPPSPDQIAQTTTDQGVTVPYIVRVETGYQNRDQYAIAVLYNPAGDWQPWEPQSQWNHKVLIPHGASCGIDHKTGTAPDVLDDAALSRGFAVMSTALNNAGHNCNVVTQAESMVMAKERIVEQYGEIRYTIGTGCSGGSLAQQQVANAYPGIYQGILPQCSFPDAWSTGQQLVDYHLIRAYVEHPDRWSPGVVWTPAEIAAIEGHPNHVNSIILDSLYFTALGDPTNPCAGVTDAERYDPETNPGGVRCTLADYTINILGARGSDGFAGRPLDNVGIQYGLDALKKGLISQAQFVDLNARIGGADIDAVWVPERVAADRPALANAYRSGGINEANNLNQVAIIDLRGPDPGAFHDAYRAFAVRARLEREHGTYANQVIWEGTVPLLGDVQYTTQGLVAMDRWLAAVEQDTSGLSLAEKIIKDKPADIHDQCSTGLGQKATDETCPLIVQLYTTPRMVAGEGISTDQNKCQLKPHRRSDYLPVEFTQAQWTQLETAFPTGVCDWSKPGVDQQDTIPWMTYNDVVGGAPLGDTPASVPFSG